MPPRPWRHTLVSRHRSSVGLRWPSKRIAALHRLPIRSVLAAQCALRCAPMAARSLRHLIRDATLGAGGGPRRAAAGGGAEMDVAGASRVADEIGATGAQAIAMQWDLGDLAVIDANMARIEHEPGPVDV